LLARHALVVFIVLGCGRLELFAWTTLVAPIGSLRPFGHSLSLRWNWDPTHRHHER
jgi:HAMP domain-containing protein